ncbi:hypothetical protein ACIRP5_10020 [Streptomyces sp. NPDC101221]|uniref:hypothetical protein n=1 Tax=Streptomyces sp. NPDC101221 TaxID=3366132 RepID=UPI0037F826AF
MSTETVSFSDAYSPEDTINARVDEDRELELTIAYGGNPTVRTVFLTGETLRAFAKLVAEANGEVNGYDVATETDTEPEPEPEPAEDKPMTDAEYHAARADAWHAARALLINSGFGFDASPEDVLELAAFLAGDNLR